MSEIFSIMRYLGTPYKHMGRRIDGLDCWGLVKLVYREMLKIELWDIGEPYPEDWSFTGKNLFMENYQKQWMRIDDPLAFDVVLMRQGSGEVNHAGVLINQRDFLHCIKGAGVITGRVTHNPYKSSIAGFYRYKGTE